MIFFFFFFFNLPSNLAFCTEREGGEAGYQVMPGDGYQDVTRGVSCVVPGVVPPCAFSKIGGTKWDKFELLMKQVKKSGSETKCCEGSWLVC